MMSVSCRGSAMGFLAHDVALLIAVLILGCAGAAAVQASGNGTVPSAATLANCPKTCGNLTFEYPFGIGVGCFRDADFELICNHSAQPPRLFLNDGNTEIIDDISASDGQSSPGLWVEFSRVIPISSGIDVYNMSWTPGRSFAGLGIMEVSFTGCNFDAYQLYDLYPRTLICTVTCPNEGITETDPDLYDPQQCNGTGCCRGGVQLKSGEDSSLNLQFVRHNHKLEDEAEMPQPPTRNSLWERIKVQVKYATLFWAVVDEPNCAAASKNKTNYACVSEHSTCTDNSMISPSYLCVCGDGYFGNPYVPGGCSRDRGYSSAPQKANCDRACGNISVPFPFGLEEGCSARAEFQLDCFDKTFSKLQLHNFGMDVSDINVGEGMMGVKVTSSGSNYLLSPGPLYTSSSLTQQMHWVVANLSCQEAALDITTYACVSASSTCLGLNLTDYNYGHRYIGYRCKCELGFQGNPYIADGCQDVDECETTPGICSGLCHNTKGSYYCTPCPHKTQYDTVQMQCTQSKRQKSLLLGILIGLGVGFGVLLIALCATFAVYRWRRDVQKKLRRKYFRENQGLLLEQLISTDENAKDKTKIFSLEDLEKATNNFDETRVLGRGGHGMVYKGILSDQRVVAIKISKVIEQTEINQFINEVAILSQISHRNIVRLFGCCLETKVPLLVYDFVPNGSLYEILHTESESTFCLSWDDCLRIAAEAAGALCYLHSAASVSVFHRDVKSSNILLDANYTAKVSDFGASRLVSIDQTHVSTLVQGTFGYLDPEYYHTGQLNEKSDVYSFGVVLLELLFRREPIFTSESGSKQNLSSYFLWELKTRPITEIVATQVREEATEEEIESVASLAEMCLRLRGEERPTMKEVEMALQTMRTKRFKSYRAVSGSELHQLIHS
ncbi:hypothetical protein SEVIR_7G052800v4 [Setaria viridis]|uniref:Protein kinase domain-containing protein n=1 Tax=Setaria viridis TaxID=4556 RepID=A0A4U6TM21_SETVI|nr:wall-associated receptor kinase-like 8 [Setaria viridis]TKW03620.1 hypothetical protein SEVIR_7G052800v2 [Setaria viridis]